MKKIIAQDKNHLKSLIAQEIEQHGDCCDLNFIDTSQIVDMNHLFFNLQFNGNISQWDTGNVKDMSHMFDNSKFTGDISRWDVSNVTNMYCMFYESNFNGDISDWNTSNVKDMGYMFQRSKFNGDISDWTPYSLEYAYNMFIKCPAPVSYWYNYQNIEDRKNAISSYIEKKNLENKLQEDLQKDLSDKKHTNKIKL